MKYTKKPITIDATRWFKNGDHPLDYSRAAKGFDDGALREFTPEFRRANNWEGDIVRYFRRPDVDGKRYCENCGNKMEWHGWIDTLEGGHIVCPGDWIITGVKGEHYPCKPDIFEATYGEAGIDAAAIRTLENLGYTYHGGELWKPPLGEAPDFEKFTHEDHVLVPRTLLGAASYAI